MVFIRASISALSSPRVSGVAGACTQTKSARVISSSEAQHPHAGGRLARIRIVGRDLHAQRGADAGELAPDRPQAHDAQGLAAQLGAAHGGVGLGWIEPTALRDVVVPFDDAAGQREHQPQRVLGDGPGVSGGRVDNQHTTPRRGLDVHVAHGATAHAHELQRRCVLKHPRRTRSPAPPPGSLCRPG